MLATELFACGGGWPRALGRRHGPADCCRATPERTIGHVARLSLTPTQPSPVGRIGGWRQQGVRRFAPIHWAARRSRTGDHPGVVAEQQPLEHGDDRQLGQEALVLPGSEACAGGVATESSLVSPSRIDVSFLPFGGRRRRYRSDS